MHISNKNNLRESLIDNSAHNLVSGLTNIAERSEVRKRRTEENIL